MTVRIGIIGVGAVADFHHVPGIRIDDRAQLRLLCDSNKELLRQRSREWGIARTTTRHEDVAADPDIDAVIIATPNFTHHAIALDCIAAGKHVMCEKPLGLNFAQAAEMYRAARDADVRHMTAFTYRFAPAMRYVRHLIRNGHLGEVRHFRSQRFLDWPETSWGWRQYQSAAGAGDLFDMTIHRIDFAIDLMGPLKSICGATAQFCTRETAPDGQACAPSDVDDWSSLIGVFQNGAVGVWEGSTVMKGYHNNGLGYEWAEVNGSQGSAVYELADPNRVRVSRDGAPIESQPVPPEFLVWPGSRRDPGVGEASTVFRYDLICEFVSAILEGRDAVPGFDDGARAQLVADSVLNSFAERKWIDIPDPL